jgi:hypothetical protein
MYYAVVGLLMFVVPLLSVFIDSSIHHLPLTFALAVALVGKWYVFWAVGIRLLLAGARQTIQPSYTARTILGIEGDDALLLVRELGFANLAIGSIGTLSLFANGWAMPAALAGGIFYALAGINHVFQRHRNRLEQVAMASDLFAAIVLLGYCAAVAWG